MYKIYIKRDPGGYWKICADNVGGRNIGIIDTEGYISAKKPVRLPFFQNRPDFIISANQKSRKNSGSKFAGWVPFGSFDAAVAWLKEHFDVQFN